jgi:hypothetical protein
MAKVWTAVPNISFELTEKEILENKYVSKEFIDPNNPTEEELQVYFKSVLDSYAESNDGSELLANAALSISCSDEEEAS